MKTSSRAQEKKEKRTSFPIICLRRNRRTTLRIDIEARIVSEMFAGAGPFLTAQREADGAGRAQAGNSHAEGSAELPPGRSAGPTWADARPSIQAPLRAQCLEGAEENFRGKHVAPHTIQFDSWGDKAKSGPDMNCLC